MQYLRIVPDGDGGSRFEDVEIGLRPVPGRVSEELAVARPIPVTTLTFAELRPVVGVEAEWHPAPRSQFAFVMSGRLEMETTDGATRQFGPGDVSMGTDVDTTGHRFRILDGPLRVIFVALQAG